MQHRAMHKLSAFRHHLTNPSASHRMLRSFHPINNMIGGERLAAVELHNIDCFAQLCVENVHYTSGVNCKVRTHASLHVGCIGHSPGLRTKGQTRPRHTRRRARRASA
ncbi:unnamed protein product [Sphagnum balticum]